MNPVKECAENILLKIPDVHSASNIIGDLPYLALEWILIIAQLVPFHENIVQCLGFLIVVGIVKADKCSYRDR